MLAWWRCTITRPTPMTTWPPRLTSTQSTSTRTWAHNLFVCQSIVTLHTAPHWFESELCPSWSSICAHDVCGSPSTLISPFSSPFTSRTSCRTSYTSLRFVANLCTQPEKVWNLLTRSTPTQVTRPTGDLRRVILRVFDQPSKQGVPEDAEDDDAAFEDVLREADRVHSHHSQREDLFVGHSSSVSDRTGRFVGVREGRRAEPK